MTHSQKPKETIEIVVDEVWISRRVRLRTIQMCDPTTIFDPATGKPLDGFLTELRVELVTTEGTASIALWDTDPEKFLAMVREHWPDASVR
jgi:hypothetical protein